MGHRARAIAAVMLASVAVAAQAQEQAQNQASAPAAEKPAAPAKPQAARTVESVTVTGASQSGFRSDIDRKSYGIASDLQITTGSISDALRNIPSVEVDPQGNVSLRGDTNVTILLDGKPSGQFKGASAGQALQALPADSIERVEVITNPSAEYSPDGAAGIINLISKKTRKPGGSGSLRLTAGDHGRRSAGLTGSYNSEKLTISGDVNGRYDPQSADGLDTRTILDGQGHELGTSQTENQGGGHLDRWGAHASLDYDLDPKTRISGDVRFSRLDIDQSPEAKFQAEDLAGVPVQAFDEPGHLSWGLGDGEVQATLRRTFGGDDHTLTVNLSREHLDEVRDQTSDLITTLPPSPTVFMELQTRNTADRSELKADYVRPMFAEGKLKAGYDLRIDDNRYDNQGRVGGSPASALPDPTQSNLFVYKQSIEAAYATYEQPFGEWTVLGGVRLENVQLDINQVTAAQTHDTNYFRAYPSLHLAYKVSDAQQLILSYSKRVQRPDAQDLNPFRIQLGPLSFQAGNPNLQPQTTDSFEAGYQYRADATFYLATLYYRQNEHGVTDVITALGGGVLLTTKENLSDSKAAGLELVANGPLTKTLSYSVSTNLYWNEIDATSDGLEQFLDFAGRRSAFEVGGRASLTWQPTPNDTFQATANVNAKRLTPQGFIEPFVLAYLGCRHKFSDALFGVVTIQDPFEGLRFQKITSTPILQDHSDQHIHIRGVFAGLTWAFGGAGKKPRVPGFDFGGAPQ